MHDPDHQRPQPLVEPVAAKPDIEPGDWRAFLAMAMPDGAVTMSVAMDKIAMRVMMASRLAALGMGMPVSRVWPAEQRQRRFAQHLSHAGQGNDAEQDEHDADGKFHRQAEPRRDHDPKENDRTADRKDCQRVS